MHDVKQIDATPQLTASGRAKIPTICFTGHRPKDLWGYPWYPSQSANYLNLYNKLLGVINAAIEHNETRRFISGMAQGVDRIAFAACVAARDAWAKKGIEIMVIAAIPFEGQEGRWPADDQKLYHMQLRQANKVIDVSGQPGYTTEKRAEDNDTTMASRKLNTRNRWMVDRSDGVIAVWSGKPNGGTVNCINYARNTSTPVNIINPFKL